eukprot:sb/3466264/
MLHAFLCYFSSCQTTPQAIELEKTFQNIARHPICACQTRETGLTLFLQNRVAQSDNELPECSGERVLPGGYYTADGGLIYKTVVDCDAMKWYNYVTDQTTEAVTEIENGDLETACVAGDDYDMWMKVEQPQIMWFSYQAQVLQTGTREVIVGEWPGYPKTVKSKINSLYDGDEASYFTITTTGSAVVTRFAFGKCFIWPESSSSKYQLNRPFSSRERHPAVNMVLYLVTMVTMLVSGGNALGCYNDVYLDNVTDHTYTIEHDIADIVTGIGSTGKDEEGFWRTRQFSYISLGHFTDDLESGDGTTITGAYYTADGGLIYKTVVDCDAMKWYNYVTDSLSRKHHTSCN